jgi:hypothetical protein
MKTLRFGAFALAAVAFAAAAARAGEEKVPLDKVPKGVLAAVKAKYPDAELKGAVREEEKGKVSFEVSIKDKGASIDVVLSEEGKILAIEKTIAASDLPKAVADAVKAKYPKAEVTRAEELTKDGKISYEVVLKDGDKKREVVLDPNGKVLEEE